MVSSAQLLATARWAAVRAGLALALAFGAAPTLAEDLFVNVFGPGTVQGNDQLGLPVINCGESGEPSACSALFEEPDEVTLTAIPQPGAIFTGWGGACTQFGTDPVCLVEPDGNAEGDNLFLFATFELPANRNVTLDVSGPGYVFSNDERFFCGPESTEVEGSATNCSDTYTQATNVTFEAFPDQEEIFRGWGGECAAFGTSPTCTLFIQGFGPLIIAAAFGNLIDSDGDGVPDNQDFCPGTPAGEPVDANGCSASQLNTDSDGDGVADVFDLCPDTPPGEAVNPRGCSQSQLDNDADGVPNASDLCPNTPLGQPVDEFGCSESQREQLTDSDGDGVPDIIDQCPNTPAGEPVDANGCSDSQRPGEPGEPGIIDSDGDGVPDDIDQCPDTPPGAAVNAVGCALSQLDSDGDGVTDDIDQCPNSDPDLPVNEVGCNETQLFTELTELTGLSNVERNVAARIDDICEELTRRAAQGTLNEGQRQLQAACSSLKNLETSDDQARDALQQISPREIFALVDYSIELSSSQFRRIQSRLDLMRTGRTQGGVSVAGLNIRSGDQMVPAQAIQSALDGLLGGLGASGDAGSDFGKLGLFIQGDLDIGKRKETPNQGAYKSDTMGFTVGADYRFRDFLFGGVSLSYGSVDVDYARDRGNSSVDNWALASYGSWQINGPWYLDGLLSYGHANIDSTIGVRYTDSAGTFESIQRGSTSGNQIFAGLNTGYMFTRGSLRAGPTASLAYIDGKVSGFTQKAEAGQSEAWLFQVDSLDIKSLRLNLGIQADYVINTGFGVLIPGIRAAYVMEAEGGSEQLGVTFVNDPFAGQAGRESRILFETDGRDSRFLDFSFNLSGQFKMGFSSFFSYQFYKAYDRYTHDGFSLGVRWDKPF